MQLRITSVSFTDKQIAVTLSDGRLLGLPLSW